MVEDLAKMAYAAVHSCGKASAVTVFDPVYPERAVAEMRRWRRWRDFPSMTVQFIPIEDARALLFCECFLRKERPRSAVDSR